MDDSMSQSRADAGSLPAPASDAQPSALVEALEFLRVGMDFAYAQGLHEIGYDPVATVRDALSNPEPR